MHLPDSAPRVAYKTYSVGEARADIAAHVVGVLCGIAGTLVLMLKASAGGSALLLVGAALYAVGLLAMLGFSAAYNLWPPSPVKELLRRFDHAAIFVMIAGTFTPFLMSRIGGAWGFGLLAFAWTVAVAGIAMKLVFPRRWERVTIALYIGLGLSILIIADRMASALSPTSIALLIAGSLTYIVGVVFHLWERLPYQNAIWHWLVLAAAILHYSAVLNEVAAAAL
ncbi:MAG: hemolysin III family protein [Alphaproteobacteria bacterium]|nr:hemolysin III family protein [Alphaproteobacteria bacterium]